MEKKAVVLSYEELSHFTESDRLKQEFVHCFSEQKIVFQSPSLFGDKMGFKKISTNEVNERKRFSLDDLEKFIYEGNELSLYADFLDLVCAYPMDKEDLEEYLEKAKAQLNVHLNREFSSTYLSKSDGSKSEVIITRYGDIYSPEKINKVKKFSRRVDQGLRNIKGK